MGGWPQKNAKGAKEEAVRRSRPPSRSATGRLRRVQHASWAGPLLFVFFCVLCVLSRPSSSSPTARELGDAVQKHTPFAARPSSSGGGYGEGEHVHGSGFALPVDSYPMIPRGRSTRENAQTSEVAMTSEVLFVACDADHRFTRRRSRRPAHRLRPSSWRSPHHR